MRESVSVSSPSLSKSLKDVASSTRCTERSESCRDVSETFNYASKLPLHISNPDLKNKRAADSLESIEAADAEYHENAKKSTDYALNDSFSRLMKFEYPENDLSSFRSSKLTDSSLGSSSSNVYNKYSGVMYFDVLTGACASDDTPSDYSPSAVEFAPGTNRWNERQFAIKDTADRSKWFTTPSHPDIHSAADFPSLNNLTGVCEEIRTDSTTFKTG